MTRASDKAVYPALPASLGTGTADATTFLRGDNSWATAGSPPSTVELLDEDTFTASGTWTRAAGYEDDDTIMIFLVGGGGSGGAGRVNTESAWVRGGACGSSLVVAVRYADMPTASYTLTVGAGGAATTRSGSTGNVAGASGGDTILENSSLQHYLLCTGGAPGGNVGTFGGEGQPRQNNFFANYSIAISSMGAIQSVDGDIGTNGDIRNIGRQGSGGVWYNGEYNALTGGNLVVYGYYANQIFGSGGGAARVGATNRTSWNAKTPALYNTGGNGSGTANGANATGIGSGGGACLLQNADATSGAGSGGGMIVRYYSGRVSPFQVLSGGV